MAIVTARRGNGEAAANPLGSHYQANAALDGLDVVRGSWEQAFAKVRSRAARRLGDAERHEINWLLRWPEHLVTVLDGGVVIPAGKDGAPVEKLVTNDHARLDRWLAKTLRASRPGQPRLRRRLDFEIDAYRVSVRAGAHFPVWLSIQGLIAGRPLRIPMAGTDMEVLDGTANLRVSVVADVKGRKRIVFRKAVKIEVAERTGAGVVGIDKGITAAITATGSDPEHALEFGTDYADALRLHSDRSFRRGRSRYWSAARTAERDKARRIRRNNLGSKRRERAARRAEAHLRNITGRAAREMVEAFPDASAFVEEALDFTVKNQPRPAGVNRRLNGWTKRRLSKDIELHVSARGARRELVSAAYTSQACPRCFWTDRGNRKGQAFRCSHCGYAGRADAVAASNVRSRCGDKTVARWTPYRAVKRLLLDQHAATTDGRCPSRGCGSGMPAVGPAGPASSEAA
jgi:predicted RNA-binding Zn-ribbon protein involved in translation (DUF1610 family)